MEDPERTKDPVDFVQRLLAEKDKYDRSAALRGAFADMPALLCKLVGCLQSFCVL